jgi:DNA-binding winged helix-turn-helix (wHTH) protein
LAGRPNVKIRFAEFTLDSDTRQVRGQTHGEVRLSTKAFDLLRILIERRPKVVDKSALHALIWPSTFVVDANLSVLVAEIRKALDDDPQDPRFIRTVHGVGYAFSGAAVEQGGRRSPAPGQQPPRAWLLWNQRTIALTEGDNILGRAPDCDVCLEAPGVSRRHALIRVPAGAASPTVEDLASTNGTLVNNAAITRRRALEDGDLIQVGAVDLTLRISPVRPIAETERIPRRRT